MNDLVPIKKHQLFDGKDDSDDTDFPQGLDNTFWLTQNDKLYCGGNLIAHPEFQYDGADWFSLNSGGKPRTINQTKFHLQSSLKQMRKLAAMIPTKQVVCSVGYFIKLDLNGEMDTNIGIIMESCGLQHVVYNESHRRDGKFFAGLIFQMSLNSKIRYVDQSIYDNPSSAVKRFIQLNPLGVNWREGQSDPEQRNPALASPILRISNY